MIVSNLSFTVSIRRGKYLFQLCQDMYTYTKSLLLRHNSRYSLLNEPIGDGNLTEAIVE